MSSSIVRDKIAAELAELERVIPAPVEPFGYGTDLSCANDLAEDFGDVDGGTTQALAEALIRMLDTPRGSLPDDSGTTDDHRDWSHGYDLRGRLNRGTSAEDLRDMATEIRAALKQDDRVDSAAVTVSPSSNGSEIVVDARVVPIDATIGPFTMTLAVTSTAVLLKALTVSS